MHTSRTAGICVGLLMAAVVTVSAWADEPAAIGLSVEADPAPPFTYWAPEGSTIKNHPRNDDVWIAERNGTPAAYYFGDQCKASEYQQFVGQPLASFPEQTAGENLRFACTECAVTSDLKFARMNVSFDEDTKVVQSVSCG